MTDHTPNHETEPCSNWTTHEDAYPDLSHCPSCGEPVNVPWYDNEEDVHVGGHRGGPLRCGQCDRDLRLPKQAVAAQRCLVCKVPEEDADASVTYIRLATGERICSTCTQDLRAYKYEVEQLTLLADWVTDEHRAALVDALAQVSADFEQDYRFTANANAEYGRMEPDVDDDLTLRAALAGDTDPGDLPDELRQEVTDGEPDEE